MCYPLSVFCRNYMIRQMMIKIFRCVEPELNNLIALGDKIDSFNSLYMLVKMSHHVWTAQNVDPTSFLSTTLGNVLVTVKRNFDKCIVSFLFFLISLHNWVLWGLHICLVNWVKDHLYALAIEVSIIRPGGQMRPTEALHPALGLSTAEQCWRAALMIIWFSYILHIFCHLQLVSF